MRELSIESRVVLRNIEFRDLLIARVEGLYKREENSVRDELRLENLAIKRNGPAFAKPLFIA